MRPAVGAMVAAWLVFGIAGVHCGIPRVDFAQTHLVAMAAGDQANLHLGSTPPCPPKFTTAESPRAPTSLVPLGVVVVIGLVVGFLADLSTAGGRGPPVRPGFAMSGRRLLTRFCLARC
ncbi:putative copper homeostasis (lipo)protein LpqS [Mycobacterium basiliense]